MRLHYVVLATALALSMSNDLDVSAASSDALSAKNVHEEDEDVVSGDGSNMSDSLGSSEGDSGPTDRPAQVRKRVGQRATAAKPTICQRLARVVQPVMYRVIVATVAPVTRWTQVRGTVGPMIRPAQVKKRVGLMIGVAPVY